ncbi:DUF4139 domain-containing protein [Sulfitobacter sp. S190]|uniref:DUF4139 domain-containing protein n=1 Tax=Sulfitobacter sp. S190 TaxID=2867022 RepID=UPI0021A28FF5|nr:DUF4139 domain-containing protein [Sulfitobacter sp. S190]UWR22276.1 DUF4139 domain-containing protein [Sulfitobacter sp. S190]
MRLAVLGFVLLPCSALADTFTLRSAPDAVTVFPGIAQVSRTAAVDLPAGRHEIVLPDLPEWVDANRLRVAVDGAVLASTKLRNDALPPVPDTDSPAVIAAKAAIDAAEAAIVALDDDVAEARLGVRSAEAQLDFLEALGNNQSLPSTAADLAAVGAMIADETRAAEVARLTAQRQIRLIEEGRPALTQNLVDARAALAALTPPRKPNARLALEVQAETEGTVEVTVRYLANASWRPTYDLFLTRGETPTVALQRAALVRQDSGENWQDVTLTLSTLAPTGQTDPGTVYGQLLRIEDPAERKAILNSAQMEARVASADFAAAPVAVEETISASFEGPGVSYVAQGKVTVAHGADAARLALDTLTFDARVFARGVPARDNTAFMMAEFVNTTDEPLLQADQAQVFVDGALVGASWFPEIPAGERATKSFGPIETLRLERTVLDRNAGDRGIINRSNAQSLAVRLDVTNLGKENWDVEVMESVPYSEQEDLVIDWTADPRPDQINVDDRQGVLQWDLSVSAQSDVQITVEQDIRWPEGQVLIERPFP